MMDSLLRDAVGMIMEGFPSGGVPDVPTGATGDDGVIELGKPSRSIIEVKQRIDELRAADCAELEAEKAALLEEAAKEEAIVLAGRFDLRTELANGATKEELAKRKADSELARDVAIIRRADAQECDERLRRIRGKWSSVSERLNASIQTVEVNTVRFAIEYLRGGRSCRMNNDQVVRAFRGIEHLRSLMNSSLGDEQLTERLIADITELQMPTGKSASQRVLWGLLTDRNKQALANLEPQQPTTKTKTKTKTKKGAKS